MSESVVLSRSKMFSVRIVRLYQWLCEHKREFVLSKQLLRSGTSIGANLSESRFAQSDADFVSKCQIALKEAAESIYWLELLKDTDYLVEEDFLGLHTDAIAIRKMISSLILTKKQHTKESAL